MLTLLDPEIILKSKDIIDELAVYGFNYLIKDVKKGGWNYVLDHVWLATEIERYIAIKPKEKLTILDVGCGGSKFHNFMENRLNINIIGIDRPLGFCHPMDAKKIKNVDYCADFLEIEAFPENSVDIIYWLSSIEHNQLHTIKQLYRKSMLLLKEGGLFLTTLPVSEQTHWFADSEQTNMSIADVMNIFEDNRTEGDFNAIREKFRKNILFLRERYEDRYKRFGPNDPQFIVGAVRKIKTGVETDGLQPSATGRDNFVNGLATPLLNITTGVLTGDVNRIVIQRPRFEEFAGRYDGKRPFIIGNEAKISKSSQRILLYADSRGDNISGHQDYRHYGDRLAEMFCVDLYLRPEKWTTTLDFLELCKHIRLEDYGAIILHTGIVDASPRHQKTAIEKIYADKKNIFDEVFGENRIQQYLRTDLGCEYEGDKTINMYSLDMARDCLLPRLKKIPNLIWIGSNRIVPGWRGNYWKERPANISLIEKYSELFASELPNVINLMTWNYEDVKRYTFDNMHFTKEGNDYVYERLLLKIKRLGNLSPKQVMPLQAEPSRNVVHIGETKVSPPRKTLEMFANKYAGRRAFIIGNGPSLNKIDLTKLKNEITFGVNSIFYNFEKMGFKPTFYVVEDWLVAEDRAGEINKLTGMVKIFGKYLNYCFQDKEDVIWANVIVDYRNYPGFPNFSKNAAECLWVGGTVSYLCMQLAYYMGFSEVYLVGFDHCYTIPQDAKVNGCIIVSTSADPNHFHSEYFGKGKRWHDPKVDRMETAYRRAREFFEQDGRKIYNATAGGKLDVFPRVDYQSLFSGQGGNMEIVRSRDIQPHPATIAGNALSADKGGKAPCGELVEPTIVSVIIPSYNSAKYLPKAIESVLAQTFPDFEIIIIDDGSTDNTAEVVNSYKDPRVKYIYQQNKDVSAARNTGIKHSRGKYITFLDADDYFLPHKLKTQAEFLETYPNYGMVGGMYLRVDEDGSILKDNIGVESGPITINSLLTCNKFVTHSTLIRREWVERVGGFDESLRAAEDRDFHNRLAKAGCLMYRMGNPNCAYRFRPNSRSANQTDTTLKVMDKTFSGELSGEQFTDLRDCARGYVYLREAVYSYAFGNAEQGKRNFEEALRYYPRFCENNYAEVVTLFLSWAEHLNIKSPAEFFRMVLDNLPEEVMAMRKRYNELVYRTLSNRVLNLFQDKHKGQRCFIIVNGPDLGRMDLSFLKNEITFGLDNVYLWTEKWSFSPTYYLCMDSAIIDQSLDSILAMSSTKILNASVLPYLNRPDGMIFLTNIDALRFAKDPRSGLGDCLNPVYYAMQMAYFMGFNEVVLVGQPHQLATVRTEQSSNNPGQPVRFDLHYVGEDGQKKWDCISRIRIAYKTAAKRFLADGRQIIDATVNSNLDIFPKADYQQFFTGKPQIIPISSDLSSPQSRWAEPGDIPRPDSIKNLFAIAGSYLSLEYFETAEKLFEKVYEPLKKAVNGVDLSACSDFENETEIAGCFLSIATKLAQCYCNRKAYGKLVQVYSDILSAKYLTIPECHKQEILNVLGKLKRVPSSDRCRPEAASSVPPHAPQMSKTKKFSERDLLLKLNYPPVHGKVLVDVGAHIGSFAMPFAERGWNVIAFEPEPENYRELVRSFRQFSNVICVDKAISDTAGQVPFYVSSEHWGIHSLKPFHPTHRSSITVETARLDRILEQMKVDNVNVLKIDIEGADLLALKSFDFRKLRPDVVICEFMDERSKSNFGYTHHDMASYMADFGYTTFVSEWSPIVEYGRKGVVSAPHRFLRCERYPLNNNPAWGNLIFVPHTHTEQFEHILSAYLKELGITTDVTEKINKNSLIEKTVVSSTAKNPRSISPSYIARVLEDSNFALARCFDKHFGQRCVIIGNGPSLNKMDLSFLKNEITFGLNRIYLLFDRWNFKPTYYVSVNPLVIEQSASEIARISSQKFLGLKGLPYIKNPQEIVFLKSAREPHFSFKPYNGIWEGHTVTFVAIQLAYFMGFSEVILIGVDHNFVAEGRPNQEVISVGSDPNHFSPDYFGKGIRWNLPDLEKSEIAYKMAKEAFEADGRRIIDATVDGKLTIFPKADYRKTFFSSQVDMAKADMLPTKADTDNKYLVSAIVSTYNAEKFICGCLEDLVNQTLFKKGQLEIIVVNSGSKQNEDAIIRKFADKYGDIVYIKTENRENLYQAWNRAVKVARGKYITNANTDDRHRSDALEVLAKALEANSDVGLAYGDQIYTKTANATFEDPNPVGYVKRPEYSRQRLLFCCCVGSQPMWRKSVHDELGYFDESLDSASDWDFWIRISGKYRFLHIPEFLGLYYENKEGIEHGRKIHSLYERYIVGRRYGVPYITTIPLYRSVYNPLVSVIIPAYNASKYITDTIESVIIQNYRNFEIVIIDDGSTDNTRDVITRFLDEGVIRYFYQDNSGLAAACNEGIRKAAGPFIIKLDSDDMMAPGFIEKHLIEFQKNPQADLVYCDDVLIGENGGTIRVIKRREYSDRKLLIRDMFSCGFPVVPFRTCIKRDVFDKIGWYDESLVVGEDYDMMRRFVKNGLNAHHLSESLYLRRINTGSHSRNYTAQKAESHFEVLRRFADTFEPEELFPDVQWDKIPPNLRKLHARCKAAVTCLAIGQNYVRENMPGYAQKAFELACLQMNNCLEMAPENQQVRQMLARCESVKNEFSQMVQQAAC